MHQRQRPIRAGLFADAQQIRKPYPWVDAVPGMQPATTQRDHGMAQRLGNDGVAIVGHRRQVCTVGARPEVLRLAKSGRMEGASLNASYP